MTKSRRQSNRRGLCKESGLEGTENRAPRCRRDRCRGSEQSGSGPRTDASFSDVLRPICVRWAHWLAEKWKKVCAVRSVALQSTDGDWIPCLRFSNGRGWRWYLVSASTPRTRQDVRAMSRSVNGCLSCILLDGLITAFSPSMRSGSPAPGGGIGQFWWRRRAA